MVIAMTRPNCWKGANDEKNSTPNPSAVVRAEPSSAEPVVASVRRAAAAGSRRLANSRSYRWIMCMV